MKKTVFFAVFLFSLFSFNLFADSSNDIQDRVKAQIEAVEQGVKDGSISKFDSNKILNDIKRVQMSEKIMMKDRKIDAKEAEQLNAMLDKTEDNIPSLKKEIKKYAKKEHGPGSGKDGNTGDSPDSSSPAGDDSNPQPDKHSPSADTAGHKPGPDNTGGAHNDDKNPGHSPKTADKNDKTPHKPGVITAAAPKVEVVTHAISEEFQKTIDAGIDAGELVEAEVAKLLVQLSKIKKAEKYVAASPKSSLRKRQLASLVQQMNKLLTELQNNDLNREWEKRINLITMGIKSGELTETETAMLNAIRDDFRETRRIMMLDRKIGRREERKLNESYRKFDRLLSDLMTNNDTVTAAVQMKKIEAGISDGSLTKKEASEIMSEMERINKARKIMLIDRKFVGAEKRELVKMNNELDRMIYRLRHNNTIRAKKAVKAAAKPTPVPAKKAAAVQQKKEIIEGILEGDLSADELEYLNKEMARIGMIKMRMMSDGELDEAETAELKEMERKLGKKIKRKRNKKWWQFWL